MDSMYSTSLKNFRFTQSNLTYSRFTCGGESSNLISDACNAIPLKTPAQLHSVSVTETGGRTGLKPQDNEGRNVGNHGLGGDCRTSKHKFRAGNSLIGYLSESLVFAKK